MIIQAYQTLQDYNKTDLAGLMTYPNVVWSGFTPMILITLFTIVLMATYFSSKRLTGRGDFISSFAASGVFTAVIAVVMTLVDGLINSYTLSITIAVAILSVILLFVTKSSRD